MKVDHWCRLSLLLVISLFAALARPSIAADEPMAQIPDVALKNLTAYFSFEGSLDSSVGEFSSSSITGDRIYNEGGTISFASGMKGQAVVLNGESGILLPNGLITGHSYSVSLWLNPQQITAFTTTFFAGLAEGDRQKWISLVPKGPLNETMLWSGNDPWYDASTFTTIPLNKWSHLAFTVDEGDVKVYLNGRERFSGTNFPDVFTADRAKFAIGVNYWDPPFVGMIDELMIFDAALSPEEITRLAVGAEILMDDAPEFRNVSVHDPMVTKVGDTYYIFGSHLAAAKSKDLIQWQQICGDWSPTNPIIPNPEEALREALEWPEPDAESTWAKSVIELNDRFFMYFSAAHWESARSNISLAVADQIEGPYQYQGMLIKKYKNGEYSEEAGEPFNDNIHPGVIDPHVFFDPTGTLWMVYGSYSGGIHILELDPDTGHPKPGQGYGTRIAGGNHAPMEGPFILYHPETGYYYLLVSFGTLAPDGGYNIRVARAENPQGPYYDPAGNRMDLFIEQNITGRDWDNAEPYGAKLIGNFQFVESGIGYLSPGHNSVYLDEDTGAMYAIFHTRFPGAGPIHSVRVHQLFLNSEGWLVMAPHRYAGEAIEKYSAEEIAGTYQYVNHGRRIQRTFGTDGGDVNYSQNIELSPDGSISGAVTGTWVLTGDYTVDITIEGQTYYGVFLKQWDDGLKKHVMTFTALSADNIAIWGSQF